MLRRILLDPDVCPRCNVLVFALSSRRGTPGLIRRGKTNTGFTITCGKRGHVIDFVIIDFAVAGDRFDDPQVIGLGVP